MNNKNKFLSKQLDNHDGFIIITVLIMLIFILTILLGVSKMFIDNMSMGEIQAYFTKSYFASEAGLEKALWEYSKNRFSFYSATSSKGVFSGVLPNGSSYSVDLATSSDAVYRYEKFVSIGSYKDAKRSVEASFKIVK